MTVYKLSLADMLETLRVNSPKPGHVERVGTPSSPLLEKFLRINVRHITDGQVSIIFIYAHSLYMIKKFFVYISFINHFIFILIKYGIYCLRINCVSTSETLIIPSFASRLKES